MGVSLVPLCQHILNHFSISFNDEGHRILQSQDIGFCQSISDYFLYESWISL